MNIINPCSRARALVRALAAGLVSTVPATVALLFAASISKNASAQTSSLVDLQGGVLVYGTYANQGQSNSVNKIPDFSNAGYRGGGVPISDKPATISLNPISGDDRQQIQNAVDQVSNLSPDASGHRGVVYLNAGTYDVSGTLNITTSGVVIRGAGQGENGTVIRATTTSQSDLFDFRFPGTSYTVQAESFDAQSGVTTGSGGTGTYVGSLHEGDWVRYDDFDFNGVLSLRLRMSGTHDGQKLRVRTDSPSGTIVGEVVVENTGDVETYTTLTCHISAVEGVKDLYFTFDLDQPTWGIGRLDYISYNRSWDETPNTRTAVTTSYAPTGAKTLTVQDASPLSVGDKIMILRAPKQAWINALGMQEGSVTSYWTVYEYKMGYERYITARNGNTLTLDAPLVQALDSAYDNSYVFKVSVPRIAECGVEHLRLEAEHAGDYDENHAWNAIYMLRCENSWVRNVTARYFGYSAVRLSTCRQVTVQDCAFMEPKSLIEGSRRYNFSITGSSTLCLVQRTYTSEGRHDHVMGARVTGPNVFLDNVSEFAYGEDGPHQRYATGVLYDNLLAKTMQARNRTLTSQSSGHGWDGAQIVYWNCEALDLVHVDSPAGAKNFALGCIGDRKLGNNRFEDWGSHVQPRSLYLQQLKDALGQAAVDDTTTSAQRDGTILDYLAVWGGEPLAVDESFDSLTAGQPPGGWTVDQSGGTVVVDNFPNSANRSIRLNDTSGTNVVSATKTFAPSSSTVIVHYRVRFGAGDNYYNSLWSGSTEAVRLRAANGYIGVENGGSFSNLRTYSANTWYSIKIIADPALDQAEIYINGVLEQSNGAFKSAVSAIDRIHFKTHSTGTGMTMHADNVLVATSPVVYAENFDGMTTGAKPARWTAYEGGGTVRIANVPSSSDKSIKLEDTSSVHSVHATKRFHPSYEKETIEYKVRFGSGDNYYNSIYGGVIGSDTNGATVEAIRLRAAGGSIQVENGSSYTSLRTYTANTWYTIKIVAYPSTNKADIYINGTLEQSQGAFKTAVDYLSQIQFKTHVSSTGMTMYTDNVTVSK